MFGLRGFGGDCILSDIPGPSFFSFVVHGCVLIFDTA